MKRVSIIGVGLIGGSLGMALRKKGYHVFGLGRNIERLKKAKKLGAVDSYHLDWSEALAQSDIVVIASPVDTIIPAYKQIFPLLKNNALVTDTGSAKSQIVRQAREFENKAGAQHFVGAHPLAGLEKGGIENANISLFKNTICVVTPSRFSKLSAEAKKLWRDAGASIVTMDAAAHDKVLSVTSHLPHVLSFGLCHTCGPLLSKDSRLKQLKAGSFRDMARVAGSSASDWAKISFQNRKEIGARIGEYITYLKLIKKNLSNEQALRLCWEKAGKIRSKIYR